MKKILFIDRDGTLIKEAPPTYQIDSFNKLEFYPGVFSWLGKIAAKNEYELVMVTNQDGLGTASFPEDAFWPVQDHIIKSLGGEGIYFSEVLIDKSFPDENSWTRKPGTGLLKEYLNNQEYDIQGSFVIGDRITDVELALNAGCKAIWLNNDEDLGAGEISNRRDELASVIALKTTDWKKIYEFLFWGNRKITHERATHETYVKVDINIDGNGKSSIDTGLAFLDHMLQQLSRHSGIDITLIVKGDLSVDEHHTIEDTAITLGEAIFRALGDKTGIERYGFVLPMDDCLATVAIDFSGRSWLVWDANFRREKIGDVPTEMFFHFFKSFSDAARCNLNIKVTGENEHHKIESIFKAMARAIKSAIKRDPENQTLPSTKGTL